MENLWGVAVVIVVRPVGASYRALVTSAPYPHFKLRFSIKSLSPSTYLWGVAKVIVAIPDWLS